MGRYLANGIPTKICVFLRKNQVTLKDDLNEIKIDLSKYVDLSMYETIVYDDAFEFKLKKEIFNKNIHELIKEIDPITPCDSYLFCNLFYNQKIDVLSDEFNKIKIELNKYGDDLEFENQNYITEDEYYIKSKDSYIKEANSFPYQFWVLDNDVRKRYYVNMDFIMLWLDYDKYDGEDETQMLRILNNMKTSYYKSVLSKSLVYFIRG